MLKSKRYLNMVIRVVIFSILCLSLQGCSANVQIRDVDIINYNSDGLVITIKTDRNLDEFTDSYYAYKVMLRYYVNNPVEDSGPTSFINQFPFSAKRIPLDDQPIGRDGNFISKWMIPADDEVNISDKRYYYSLGTADINFVTITLYGATMGGGHLDSSPYRFQVTNKIE